MLVLLIACLFLFQNLHLLFLNSWDLNYDAVCVFSSPCSLLGSLKLIKILKLDAVLGESNIYYENGGVSWEYIDKVKRCVHNEDILCLNELFSALETF